MSQVTEKQHLSAMDAKEAKEAKEAKIADGRLDCVAFAEPVICFRSSLRPLRTKGSQLDRRQFDAPSGAPTAVTRTLTEP
jgi:hypothetical protein